MTRPLVSLTVAFCGGIIFGSLFAIPFLILFVINTMLLASSFVLLNRQATQIFLFFLAFGLGALFWKNAGNLPKSHILRLTTKAPLVVRGIIKDEPQTRGNRTFFSLKVESVETGNVAQKSCGTILVFFKGSPDFSYGDELILRGSPQRGFARSIKQEKPLILRVRSLSDAARLSRNKGSFMKRVVLRLKAGIEAAFSRHTSSLTAGVLSAMVLGEKRNIPWFVNNLMVKTGTVHILVVSGFNVGIVAFAVLLLLKIAGLPRNLRFIITIFCLLVYCLLTGASTPVVRATVMAIFFLLAYLIRREPDIYNSLSMAALFILAFNPGQLFDIGFQLSFVSVLAIVCLYPGLSKLVNKHVSRKGGVKWLKFFIDSILVSLSAWLGTLGFIAFYFKIFSPVTVLANLVVVPLATLITLCGFSLVLVSLTVPGIAFAFGASAEALVFVLLRLNAFLANLPGACLKF